MTRLQVIAVVVAILAAGRGGDTVLGVIAVLCLAADLIASHLDRKDTPR